MEIYVGRIKMHKLKDGQIVEEGAYYKKHQLLSVTNQLDNVELRRELLDAYQDAVKISKINFTDGWAVVPNSIGVDCLYTRSLGQQELDVLLAGHLSTKIVRGLPDHEKELFTRYYALK